MNNYFKKLTEIRGVLAILLTISCISILFTTIIIFGKEKEVLMFVLSQISTIIGVVIGYYFGSSHKSSNVDNKENTNNDNNIK